MDRAIFNNIAPTAKIQGITFYMSASESSSADKKLADLLLNAIEVVKTFEPWIFLNETPEIIKLTGVENVSMISSEDVSDTNIVINQKSSINNFYAIIVKFSSNILLWINIFSNIEV